MSEKQNPKETRLLDDAKNTEESEQHTTEEHLDSLVLGPDERTLDGPAQSKDSSRSGESVDGDDNNTVATADAGDISTSDNERLHTIFKDALANLKKAKALQARAFGFLRKTTFHVFEAGRVLDEARKILTNGKLWCAWLKEYEIPRTSAWEAIQLFRRAKSVSAIEGLQITEAKIKFGIQKPRGAAGDGDETTDATSNAMVAQKQKSSAGPTGEDAGEIEQATPNAGQESNDTADQPAASEVAPPMANPTAEELEAFATFAHSVLTEDNAPEAVLSYLEACQDDTDRASHVMDVAITQVRESFKTGTRVVEGTDD